MPKSQISIFAVLLLLSIGCTPVKEYDVCVYGGTSSGVVAAYSAAMQGLDVLLISPENMLGGMSSGGLGYTDIGNKQVVEGVAKQFYRKIGHHYGRLEQWTFEPHVAEGLFEDYAAHKKIRTLRGHRLNRVCKEASRIKSISVISGRDTVEFAARVFIDCSYEGDLMAKAGVSYSIGREDNAEYGESWNGFQMLHGHQFPDGVDPFVVEGDPLSGLLWGICGDGPRERGSGDTLTQAYNFRICLTDSLENMIPITKPADYDSSRYELLLRLFKAQPDRRRLSDYLIISRMPGRKTDINNRGGFSTDMIGMNHNYPEASYEERRRIIKAHEDYTRGLLYFMGHDGRVPEEIRAQMLAWGYPKDEYKDNGGWTPQLYIRESRRMKGWYVCTQADCEGRTRAEDGVAFAAYTMDSHNCQRLVVNKDGRYMVKNEGNVEVDGGLPYPISYRSLTPFEDECANILVPVCLSASHIAYGSIRMEPVFMVLGQVCGIAASLALENGVSVQNVNHEDIVRIMKADPYLDGSRPDVIIDDVSVRDLPEGWERIRAYGGYGPSFLQSFEPGEGVEYEFPERLEGEYAVYVYQQTGWVDSLAVYLLNIGDRVYRQEVEPSKIRVDGQTYGEWICMGHFRFNGKERASVRISGGGGSGRPAKADAVMLVPVASAR